MNKQIAIQLKKKAEDVAQMFSDPLRDHNPGRETFELEKIIALSEYTAAGIYLKNSGKRAIAFLYYNNGNWWFLFPSDSHLVGMSAFAEVKRRIEEENFKKNFMGEKGEIE